ncbi:hypothetical protein PpBr36_05394 [Pyricularia pennisetigena]|uniref:hypothetical protein n=1 Tax=Pyricularia pennisetigena TaxID=1578925 RepID=UPI001151F163|nr:hypothetical protein PpBr36_05394 [Pyricularia pennisetigena]TLS27554.1 hypothetical protein PpBr36_05394 [Pyricularia pennisetigena]
MPGLPLWVTSIITKAAAAEAPLLRSQHHGLGRGGPEPRYTSPCSWPKASWTGRYWV